MLHWCHHHHTNNSRLLHDHSSQKRQSTKLKLSWPPCAILMPHNIMSSNFPFCLSILFIYLLVLLSFSFSFSLFSSVISTSFSQCWVLLFLTVLWQKLRTFGSSLNMFVTVSIIQNCSSVFSTIHHCCCRCFQFLLLTDVLLDSDICITLFHHLPISLHFALFCKGWKSCECLWRDSHGCDVVCVKHMKLSHTHTHEWKFFFLSCEQMIYIAVEELHPTQHLSLHVQEQNQSIVFFAGSCGG